MRLPISKTRDGITSAGGVCDWGKKRLNAGPTNGKREGRISNVYDLSLSRLSSKSVLGVCMETPRSGGDGPGEVNR